MVSLKVHYNTMQAQVKQRYANNQATVNLCPSWSKLGRGPSCLAGDHLPENPWIAVALVLLALSELRSNLQRFLTRIGKKWTLPLNLNDATGTPKFRYTKNVKLPFFHSRDSIFLIAKIQFFSQNLHSLCLSIKQNKNGWKSWMKIIN